MGGVFFARDGYLIQKFDAINASRFVSNTAQLKKLSDQAAALGLPCTVMPIPTAVQILEDKLPAFATHADQSQAIAYLKEQGLDVVDVTQALTDHSGEYIYYRTDHHYTSLGGLLLLRRLSGEPGPARSGAGGLSDGGPFYQLSGHLLQQGQLPLRPGGHHHGLLQKCKPCRQL